MAFQGNPPPLMFKAGMYNFVETSDTVSISVPIRGEYPKDFKEGKSYDISPTPGTFLFGVLTEALFAFKKYPDLKKGQYFMVLGFEIGEEEISVIGKAINILEP